VRVAVIEVEGVRVTTEPVAHERLVESGKGDRTRYAARGLNSPGVVDGAKAARSLFQALKVAPTKIRPSSEALLRRTLRQKPLSRINTLVDEQGPFGGCVGIRIVWHNSPPENTQEILSNPS